MNKHHCLHTDCVPVEENSQGKQMCDDWEIFYDGWISNDDKNTVPSAIADIDTENADDNSMRSAEFEMVIDAVLQVQLEYNDNKE